MNDLIKYIGNCIRNNDVDSNIHAMAMLAYDALPQSLQDQIDD